MTNIIKTIRLAVVSLTKKSIAIMNSKLMIMRENNYSYHNAIANYKHLLVSHRTVVPSPKHGETPLLNSSATNKHLSLPHPTCFLDHKQLFVPYLLLGLVKKHLFVYCPTCFLVNKQRLVTSPTPALNHQHLLSAFLLHNTRELVSAYQTLMFLLKENMPIAYSPRFQQETNINVGHSRSYRSQTTPRTHFFFIND